MTFFAPPLDLLVVLGLGLMAGLRGAAASRLVLLALPGGWLCGGWIGSWYVGAVVWPLR